MVPFVKAGDSGFVEKKPSLFFRFQTAVCFVWLFRTPKIFGFGWFQTTKKPRGTAGSGGVPDPSACADLSTITSQAGRSLKRGGGMFFCEGWIFFCFGKR